MFTSVTRKVVMFTSVAPKDYNVHIGHTYSRNVHIGHTAVCLGRIKGFRVGVGGVGRGTGGPHGRAAVTDAPLAVSVDQAGGAGRATAAVGARGTAAGGTADPTGRATVTDAPLTVSVDQSGGAGRATAVISALSTAAGGTAGPTATWTPAQGFAYGTVRRTRRGPSQGGRGM